MDRALPALYLTLLIFLFMINATTQSRTTPRICSSSCGEITNISYPYRLNTDPADCGDPDFELTCNNNTTMLNYYGGSYIVKRIAYDQHLLRVADVNLANGSCGLPHKSLSFEDFYRDGRYLPPGNYNYSYTLNYVRCRGSNISDMANSRVPCLSGNMSSVYVNISGDMKLYEVDLPNSCDVVSALPATYEEDRVGYNSSYEKVVVKMQESGFDMLWSVECRDCRAKLRSCVLASRDTTFLFKCQEEYDERRAVYTWLALVIVLPIVGFIMFAVLFAFICKKYCASKKKKTDVMAESAQNDQQP